MSSHPLGTGLHSWEQEGTGFIEAKYLKSSSQILNLHGTAWLLCLVWREWPQSFISREHRDCFPVHTYPCLSLYFAWHEQCSFLGRIFWRQTPYYLQAFFRNSSLVSRGPGPLILATFHIWYTRWCPSCGHAIRNAINIYVKIEILFTYPETLRFFLCVFSHPIAFSFNKNELVI